jgi:hypothetical protein
MKFLSLKYSFPKNVSRQYQNHASEGMDVNISLFIQASF